MCVRTGNRLEVRAHATDDGGARGAAAGARAATAVRGRAGRRGAAAVSLPAHVFRERLRLEQPARAALDRLVRELFVSDGNSYSVVRVHGFTLNSGRALGIRGGGAQFKFN